MLRNGKILNTPCVSSDVTRYREFIGTCTGCAKGKMTAKSAKPSLTTRSTKCGELVHVDLMFFGGFIFLVAVDDFSRTVLNNLVSLDKLKVSGDIVKNITSNRDPRIVAEQWTKLLNELHQ
jgi:hypothetical protein